ncbi:MAG: D-alanyl-D-alanine carboxypeptidase/D-alanyl-D-alanine-endopeptidase (penicillin-binding protein 4) [Myxococcota bacterium]|jgi:D-alanyl-D-alanine carboxypeptidase/D-alanyl-D-alanine-endopeptidase (penicillin-binding protein 4)
MPKAPPALLITFVLSTILAFLMPQIARGEDVVGLPGILEPLLGALRSDRLFREGEVGIAVVDLETGELVFGEAPTRPLVPASTMKVLTAAAALRYLGPAWRFTTEVYVDGEIDAEGTLNGNLYIKGTGDPTMVVERLWKLVMDIRLSGIERIAGRVVLDETYMKPEYRLPGWGKERDIRVGPSYFPTLSALTLNHNAVGIIVGPGTAVGESARVQLETEAPDYVTVVNEVTTGSSRSRRWLDIEREVVDGRMRYTVTGSVPAGAEAGWYYRTVEDPTSHFAAALAHLTKSQGLSVARGFRRGTVPQSADLLFVRRSAPLGALLMEMNKNSLNLHAELVLRALGAEVEGGSGTTAKGLTVVARYLSELGVPEEQYTLVNGSGLSRTAGLSPASITAVLADMAGRSETYGEFYASLAIAGRDGTLWRRLTDAPGRLRGKTGTIDGVHCLVGYVDGVGGRRYAFAFLVNGFTGGSSRVKRLHDRFARQMFTVSGDDAAVVAEDGE